MRPTGLVADAVRRMVVPAVVAVPLLAACWRVSETGSLGTFPLWTYVAVAAFLVLCEQWLPIDRRWGSTIGAGRTDVVYVVVATVMDKAMFVACVTVIASLGRTAARAWDVAPWPSDASFVLQLALALLVADAGTYLRHRLSHESDFLWRFHRVHHSMTGLYWIRSAYTHPFEQFLILSAIMLPIAFLGAGDQVIAAVAFLFGLSGLVQHANVDARSSILNWIFATPEVHRIHHGADTGRHANFSAFFVLMDHLFRTYDPPTPTNVPARVGLPEEPDFPTDFGSQLTIPFRPQRASETRAS